MKTRDMDEMILELLDAVDYDIAKSFDPILSEDPETITERMAELRRIVGRHLKKASIP